MSTEDTSVIASQNVTIDEESESELRDGQRVLRRVSVFVGFLVEIVVGCEFFIDGLITK